MKRFVIMITVSSALITYNVHAQQNHQLIQPGHVPTVSIEASVQADSVNRKSVTQNSDINIFGGVQAGSDNSYDIQQTGDVNSVRIGQYQHRR
ncbi:MAG: hypothetical protein ABFS56_11995 [Pseudomonadota bacterium]